MTAGAAGAYGRWLAHLACRDLLDINALPGNRMTVTSLDGYVDHARHRFTDAPQTAMIGAYRNRKANAAMA